MESLAWHRIKYHLDKTAAKYREYADFLSQVSEYDVTCCLVVYTYKDVSDIPAEDERTRKMWNHGFNIKEGFSDTDLNVLMCVTEMALA